jgi:hypothetical protein
MTDTLPLDATLLLNNQNNRTMAWGSRIDLAAEMTCIAMHSSRTNWAES